MKLSVLLAGLLAAAVVLAHGAAASSAELPGFTRALQEPSGGSIWVGRIPNRALPADRRPAAVYVPGGIDPGGRYPVVYLLHGMPGSPSSFYDSLQIARVADALRASGRARPFFAVMPWGGPVGHRAAGEWAGVWEDYVVRDVLPWIDAHLPTIPEPAGRALAGLSAGGFGAVDIGLRHPGLFGTLESWNGYFAPLFRDGPFATADAAILAAHTPSALVRTEALLLRRERVRFFLSAGGAHGGILPGWTTAFGSELQALGLEHKLWLLPPGQHGFYRLQLGDALSYALAAS